MESKKAIFAPKRDISASDVLVATENAAADPNSDQIRNSCIKSEKAIFVPKRDISALEVLVATEKATPTPNINQIKNNFIKSKKATYFEAPSKDTATAPLADSSALYILVKNKSRLTEKANVTPKMKTIKKIIKTQKIFLWSRIKTN